MSDNLPRRDFEKLAVAELDAAARSATSEKRRAHLDQAATFATLGERVRGSALSDN